MFFTVTVDFVTVPPPIYSLHWTQSPSLQNRFPSDLQHIYNYSLIKQADQIGSKHVYLGEKYSIIVWLDHWTGADPGGVGGGGGGESAPRSATRRVKIRTRTIGHVLLDRHALPFKNPSPCPPFQNPWSAAAKTLPGSPPSLYTPLGMSSGWPGGMLILYHTNPLMSFNIHECQTSRFYSYALETSYIGAWPAKAS